LWANVSGRAAVTLPYIGLGIYNNTNASMELHNPGYPEFDTYFVNDNAVVLGGALPIGPSSYLGMNFKRIDRWGGINQDLGLQTIANASDIKAIGNSFANKGTGYGVDLAAMTVLDAVPFNPSLAVVWQDVGNTSFTKTAGTDAPPHITQNLSAGVGASFDLPGIDWAAGFEMRHLLEPDVQLGKKVHLGTELSLPLIDLRGGINEGYFTYGVGVNFLIFHFDAAYYTEEIGAYPGQTADNRYVASVSIDLSFDADFHFTDNNGQRRKLKQRR
jgi:hypothetical protein